MPGCCAHRPQSGFPIDGSTVSHHAIIALAIGMRMSTRCLRAPGRGDLRRSSPGPPHRPLTARSMRPRWRPGFVRLCKERTGGDDDANAIPHPKGLRAKNVLAQLELWATEQWPLRNPAFAKSSRRLDGNL